MKKVFNYMDIDQELVVTNMRASKMVDEMVTRGLLPYGISKAQFDVLAFIYYSHGQLSTVTEIAADMYVSKANITGITNRLLKINLIQKNTNNRDARVNELVLTTKGNELIETLIPVYHGVTKSILSIFSNEEKNILLSQLKHIENSYRDNIKK